MKCPVCKRELAPTLSICFTCGAMVNDSVREELETKIGRVSGPLEKKGAPPPVALHENGTPAPAKRPTESPAVPAPAATAKPKTSFLAPKTTSKTLVDFQPKAPTLPDWRLQVQNAVRKRNGGEMAESEHTGDAQIAKLPPPAAREPKPTAAVAETTSRANPTLAKALQRIEASRQTYMPGSAGAAAVARKPIAARSAPPPVSAPVQKSYPFDVVQPKPTVMPARQAEPVAAPTVAPAKPKLVSSLRIEKKKYDTNKLPPIPQPAELSSSFDSIAAAPAIPAATHTTFVPEREEVLSPDEIEMNRAFESESEPDVFDDIPPFGMRFAAGLFDVLASAFGTVVILSPLLFGQNAVYSLSLGIGFAAVFAAFLFLYLTASLALRGKSLGMWMFSLELIDAEHNSYPTAHQAAVHSAVYVLSLALLGLGFVTIAFDEEKRAIHDIISGTIMVKQA